MLKTIPFLSKSPVIPGFLPEVHSYGFNGMEKQNEHISGNYDFGARILDTRLGRWLSVDPLGKDFPMLSPYSYSANNPIFFVDPDGRKIIPAADKSGHTSVNVSIAVLDSYFKTAFGLGMANLFTASTLNGVLGNFSAAEDPRARETFAANFQAQLSNINDEFTKVLAIGVYEAIMSDESVSFIGYVSNGGQGSIDNSDRNALIQLGAIAANAENYCSLEPMVNGANNLCELQNDVDVLYDKSNGDVRNRSLSSGVFSTSNGNIQNFGDLYLPLLALSINYSAGTNLAVKTLGQIAATNRQLNEAQSSMASSPVLNPDNSYFGRQSSANASQSFFNNIIQQVQTNLTGPSSVQDTSLSRSEKRAVGEKYSPDRTNFSSSDGE